MLCSLSRIGEKELGEITQLEKEVGHPLLAYSCFQIEPARLPDADLDKIKQLESRLGIALVAVE